MSARQILLDDALCDSMYSTLNDTNVFKYDEELKSKHSQVCAVLDRLRHATSWINAHQDTPMGVNAPTQLMTFMMFASMVKDSIEKLRVDFGLNSVIFDKGRPESRTYFADACCGEPLNIPIHDCPTDDAFFQYFRSLVFAHSGKITMSQGALRPGEIQYCPFIVEHGLKNYPSEPDDYVGVMIYSTEADRDGKTLRVRFSALKEYVKSRYESLGLVLVKIEAKIKSSRKAWIKVSVDPNLAPLEQLKFVQAEYVKRCDDWMAYEVGRLIELLESPISLPENQDRVAAYRKEIEDAVPRLSECFTRLDHSGVIDIVDYFSGHEVDESLKLNYTLRKIFEYLSDGDRREWATRDIDMIANDFAKKWVRIDQTVMSDAELKMLITLACFSEYGRFQKDLEEN
jgi:hypothetical protein